MDFIRKHLKILAGAAMLLMTLAWVVWPQGDLPKAARLMEKGDYEQAAEILDRVVRQRRANREIQVLYTRALLEVGRVSEAEGVLRTLRRGETTMEVRELIARYQQVQAQRVEEFIQQGNSDEAEKLLRRLVYQEFGEGLRAAAVSFARHHANQAEWELAVQGWMWAVKDGWEPPFAEFQTHLAKNLMFDASSPQTMRDFILDSLNSAHPLARLALLTQNRYKYFEINREETEANVAFLSAADWSLFDKRVVNAAKDVTLHYKTLLHLLQVAEGEVAPLQGLQAEEVDYCLEFIWSYLGWTLRSLANSLSKDFDATYAQFLDDHTDLVAFCNDSPYALRQEPWLGSMISVWKAAVRGNANNSGSEAARFLAGVNSRGSIIGYVQTVGESNVMLWSNDGAYCGVGVRKHDTWQMDLLIIQRETGKVVQESAGISSISWSPVGHSFIILADNHQYYYSAPESEPVELRPRNSAHTGYVYSWYDDQSLLTSDGELYDLDLNSIGNISDTFPEPRSFSYSGTGLVLGNGLNGISVLYDQGGKALAQVATGFIGGYYWSPRGDKVLLRTYDMYYNYNVILSRDGGKPLLLPVGGTPQGWLDQDRLLVKRELGPVSWYVYTLSTGEVQYIRPPEGNPENIYPAGDGKTVAWSTGGITYLGRLKLDD